MVILCTCFTYEVFNSRQMLNYQNVNCKCCTYVKGKPSKNCSWCWFGVYSFTLLWMLKTKWRHNDQSSRMRRVFVWLHPASPCCWLLLPPPHSEQCITSHKSASSGELQSCSSRAGTQWPQFLWEKSGSGHKVDRELGMESWKDGGHWRFCISIHCACDSHRIWPYSSCFAWIFVVETIGKMAQNRRWCCMLSWS